MKKVLFISNIAKRVGSFSVASIAAAKECGMEYYYAANWENATILQREEDQKNFGINLVHIDLARSPYSFQNIRAYKQLIEIIEKEKIDYIHCNTPVGGILGRLVGQKCRVKRVIYQVHGFHFFKGAPMKNWLIYYPVEKWLAHKTDAIITINGEDNIQAKKFKLRRNGKVFYVPGVGIDTTQYNTIVVDKLAKRRELGLSEDCIVLISAGDLIERKNYETAINAIAKTQNPKLHYLICGRGPKEEELMGLASKLGVNNQVHFLGFRTDMKELLQCADIFLFTTLQEGLPRSMMEAMASGLPCVASNIRGNVDLFENGTGGLFCSPNDSDSFADAINKLAGNSELREQMGKYNLQRIDAFSFGKVKDALKSVYEEVFS